MDFNQFKKPREPLFSIHTSDDGSVAIYLEEQDAIKDVIEDVVGQWDVSLLGELRGCIDGSWKNEDYFENLETCRSNFEEGAIKLIHMSEEEALNLTQDIIKAIKISRHMREERIAVNLGLRVVK